MPAHAIVAPSGAGKSTSIMPPATPQHPSPIGLDPKTTFILMPDRKPLPIRGWQSMYRQTYYPAGHALEGQLDLTQSNLFTHDFQKQGAGWQERSATNPKMLLSLMQQIEHLTSNRAETKGQPRIWTGVIDTLNHIMTRQFMKLPKSLGFDKYTQIGEEVLDLVSFAQTSRIDWFFMFHIDEVRDPLTGAVTSNIKTVGKLLNEKVDLQSYFTTVLGLEMQVTPTGRDYRFVSFVEGSPLFKAPYGMFPGDSLPNDLGLVVQTIRAYNQGVSTEQPAASPPAEAKAVPGPLDPAGPFAQEA